MKKSIFHSLQKSILLLFVFTFVVSTGFPQGDNGSNGAWYCQQHKINAKTFPGNKSPNTPTHAFDVLKYTMNLDLYNCYASPYPHSFQNSEIVHFKADSSISQITLNAADTSIAVYSVGMNAVSFSHNNNILTLQLDKTYSPGEVADVSINYQHLDVVDGAFYTGNGFAYTDCEPEKARFWFPCWDRPSDKALVDITAKVPDNVLLGSNGRLQDSTHIADAIYYHWVSRDPVATYLTVITSKVGYHLDVLYWPLPSNPSTKIPIRYYYNDGENPAPSEQVILDMITYYSTLFCEHPFEKTGFCTLDPQFIWGGMENQTLISFCQNCWTASLTSHEFAHQWFGDMISPGTWADIFLNEGFATYIEALWIEHQSSYVSYKTRINGDASYYLNNNPGWAISNPAWAVTTPDINVLFNYATTYCKGACLLHMFRYTVGDSLFFASLHAYANDTVNFKFKNAVIADFITKMSQVCNQNLDWFFNEWLFQPDHPIYDNKYFFYDNGNGTWKVNFFASQIQTTTGFFTMPVVLKIQFQDGTDTSIRVMNDQNNQSFQFLFNKQPVTFTFDPNDDIVLKEGSTTVGITELTDNTALTLGQNNPNPFNDVTEISVELSTNAKVKIAVYDMMGRIVSVVADKEMTAGKHTFTFNATGIRPGMYYYSLESNKGKIIRKMVVVK